jgi:dihydrofolate reductase
VLHGDVAEAVAMLKQENGADLHVIGSAELVQILLEHGLVDELRLMIDPVTLGAASASSATTVRVGRCGSSTPSDDHRGDPRDLRTR